MKTAPLLLALTLALAFSGCATRWASSAEEYYTIGMAYYDLGKFEDAEKWLNRAKAADKTLVASEYNLGRIAYEQGRFEEALTLFERVLARDPDNVLAMKAVAYSRIKNEKFDDAERLYNRILELEPDTVDQGYNYALVLIALDKNEQAEEVLLKYKVTMADNKDTLLLLARVQKTLGKVEAVDTYSQWLAENTDVKVRYEYAQVLEAGEFYAKALEEYRGILEGMTAEKPVTAEGLDKAPVRFTIARLMLIADPEKEEGLTELETAVTEGFADTEKLTALLDEEAITAAHKDGIRKIIEGLEKVVAEKAAAEKEAAEKAEAEKAAAEKAALENPAPDPAAAAPGGSETTGTTGTTGTGGTGASP